MAKKLRYFKILIDDESLLYFPGVFLTGKVVLELDEDTPILGECNHTLILNKATIKLNQFFQAYSFTSLEKV